MAMGGALAFAPVEYLLTLSAYAGDSSLVTRLRLAALTATLSLLLFLILAVSLSAVMAGTRVVHAQVHRERARGPGWFIPSALGLDGIRAGVPRLWGVVTASLVLLVAVLSFLQFLAARDRRA